MSLPQGIIGGVLALGFAATNILAGVGSASPPAPALKLEAAKGTAVSAPMWTGDAGLAVLHAKWGDVLPEPAPTAAPGAPANDAGGGDASGALFVRGGGIPEHLQRAYVAAAAAMPATCHLTPAFLAAIGQVESGNLSGRAVGDDHVARPGVYGPDLTGGPYANIPDSDGGVLDGISTWDRAVGPMQFIPGTWASWGSDGDGDGRADPQNVYDAALSAARYLCAGGRDLSTDAGITAALWSYNQSTEYAVVVRSWYAWYSANGVVAGSGGPAVVAAAQPSPSATPTPTPTPSLTPTPSPTASPAATTPGPSPSTSASTPPSPTSTPSSSATSASPSPTTATVTPTPTPTPASPTASSPSPTASPTAPCVSPTASPSGTISATPSPTSTTAPCTAVVPGTTARTGDPAATSTPATTAAP